MEADRSATQFRDLTVAALLKLPASWRPPGRAAYLCATSGDALRALWIAPQYPQHNRNLPQMIQRVLRVGRIHLAQEVEVEQVLPWLSPQGPRLDLGQVEIPQRERAQRTKQSARDIARAEDQRGLPRDVRSGLARVALSVFRGAQEEKTGEILAVAFNRPAQNAAAINPRGHRGGNRSGIGKSLLHHHLDAAGSVVEWNSFDLRIFGKEIQALIEGYWMGKSPLNVGKGNALDR